MDYNQFWAFMLSFISIVVRNVVGRVNTRLRQQLHLRSGSRERIQPGSLRQLPIALREARIYLWFESWYIWHRPSLKVMNCVWTPIEIVWKSWRAYVVMNWTIKACRVKKCAVLTTDIVRSVKFYAVLFDTTSLKKTTTGGGASLGATTFLTSTWNWHSLSKNCMSSRLAKVVWSTTE